MKKNLLQFQENLANEYGYKKLPKAKSEDVQNLYIENIYEWLNVNGDTKELYTLNGTKICSKYDRIVIGDYGAFIEIDKDDFNKNVLIVKKGQEYRINDSRYSERVKYYWYTVDDNSDIKVYYQKRTVTYADYKPNKYYISVYECKII